MNGTLKISMLISLSLHLAVFALPGINRGSFLSSIKETKLIEVSLKKLKPKGREEEISPRETKLVKDPLRKEEALPRGAKEEFSSEEILLAQNEIEEANLTEKEVEEEPDIVKAPALDYPQGEGRTPPKRIVDLQGYPPEAVEAVFKRYGMRYERYSDELGQATTSNLVSAFTLDKEQLKGEGGSSPVTFSGKPKPGSMVLVIPPKVNLAILEAEREELRKRGLPFNTPLKKVVFGIGRDSQGQYALTVRELVLHN